jgi:AraC-like DNA-binding protein
MTPPASPLRLLSYPYRALEPLQGRSEEVRQRLKRPGSALIWDIGSGFRKEHYRTATDRPGGTSLVIVLPPAERLRPDGRILKLIEATRPMGVLPHHEVPNVEDLTNVLSRPPSDLAADVVEYLLWRGIRMSGETRHLVRRTVELSANLRSITALSRGFYLSRRALGRRFETEGLPVPSHWLHFSRLLRVTLRLQNTDENVVTAGYRFGYSDGFSLSNQMHRLTGFRPRKARRLLGWEWFLEAWLRKEASDGGLRPRAPAGADPTAAQRPAHPPSVSRIGRAAVAEQGPGRAIG